MKFFSRIAGVVVVLALVVVAVSGAVAQDSTVDRAALVQKISGFLKTEAVVKSFAEKGVDTSKIISKLDSLSDAQLVQLSEQASGNLSQVGGALDDSGSNDFLKFYGMYMLFSLVIVLILIAAA
ncbi:MAG: hypothetical protein Q7T53_05485 [Deltaproteobacteria bacterium]|nr:hypothetical protein [Deltaproteobacteria bacterium]